MLFDAIEPINCSMNNRVWMKINPQGWKWIRNDCCKIKSRLSSSQLEKSIWKNFKSLYLSDRDKRVHECAKYMSVIKSLLAIESFLTSFESFSGISTYFPSHFHAAIPFHSTESFIKSRPKSSKMTRNPELIIYWPEKEDRRRAIFFGQVPEHRFIHARFVNSTMALTSHRNLLLVARQTNCRNCWRAKN